MSKVQERSRVRANYSLCKLCQRSGRIHLYAEPSMLWCTFRVREWISVRKVSAGGSSAWLFPDVSFPSCEPNVRGQPSDCKCCFNQDVATFIYLFAPLDLTHCAPNYWRWTPAPVGSQTLEIWAIPPFPFCSTRLPFERFRLVHDPPGCHFEYIGREFFSRVCSALSELNRRTDQIWFYIQGIVGYGKSHILSAVACLRIRGGKRVIYLPHCSKTVERCYETLSPISNQPFSSPLPAFLHPRFVPISEHFWPPEVLSFDARSLYFIIDQMNAFNEESPNRDAILDGKKNKLLHEVYEMSAEHYLITSVSANYQMTKQSQTNSLKLSMMGEMSKLSKSLMPFPFPIFIRFGWIHYQTNLPTFENGVDKCRVEDLPGCIHLLLRRLLGFNPKPFHKWKMLFGVMKIFQLERTSRNLPIWRNPVKSTRSM